MDKDEGRETEETGGTGKITSDTPAPKQQGGRHRGPGRRVHLNKQDGALLLSRAPRRQKWGDTENPEVKI